MNNNNLQEGVDFYWKESDGIRFRVFTESYLLKRGFCCGNKCINCPYNKKENKNGKQSK
jgi:hypothetical protein